MRWLRRLGWVLGGWVLWRSFGPELPRGYRMPQRRPVRVPGRTVFVGDKEMFVREVGPEGAPTLVLVHGWGFDGEMTYYPLIGPLSERYRLVIPDMRNHGKSDWVRGPYDVEDLADELAGVLDAVGVSRGVVMGYSLGGMVAQSLAARHPRFVAELVLAATAAWPVAARRPLTRVAFLMGRAFTRLSSTEAAALSTMALRHAGAIDRYHERWAYDSLRRRDGALSMQAGWAAFRFDSRPWVGRIGVPVTVFVVGADHIVSTVTQRELAALLPAATVVDLEGADHESIFSHRQVYLEVLGEIMARQATP